MYIPFLKRKQLAAPEEEVKLALDIGTAFVKALIFQIKDGEVRVKGYAKVKQQSNSMRGAMIVNMKKVTATCDLAIGEALNMADKILSEERTEESYEAPTPSSVVLGIAGELVKGVAIQVNYEREDPNEKISRDEINEVVESVKEQSFVGVVDDIAEEMGIDTDQIVEINSVIDSTYIDGIKIDDPEGFTGKEVSYRVFSSFAPAIHLNSLKEIASNLDLELTSIEVEPYVVAKALKGAREEGFSGIIVDIGGGTTDIALVDNGGVVGTKMFAYGGTVFTRRLEVDMDVDVDTAEKRKIDYSNLKLSDTEAKAVKSSLAKDIPAWVEGVEISLADFEDVKVYPSDIYLCGGGAGLPDLRTGLIEHPWLQVLNFKRFPKTHYIFPNQLASLVDDTKKLTDQSDIAPAALALSVLDSSV